MRLTALLPMWRRSLSPFVRDVLKDPIELFNERARQMDNLFRNSLLDSTNAFWNPRWHWRNSGVCEVVNNEKEFRVGLDLQQFKPEEISIKAKDNQVIIQAKHEEKSDENGFMKREFVQQYTLPEDVDTASLSSSVSSDGVLTIKAPKKNPPSDPETRSIPITFENSEEKKS